MAPRKSKAGSADPRIPEKQYFRIGEVAEIAGVEAYVLRFWETEFPSLAPGKTRSGRRQYNRSDVGEVLRIRDLLYEDGFTIAGARRHLADGGEPEGRVVPAKTRDLLKLVQKEAREILRLVSE